MVNINYRLHFLGKFISSFRLVFCNGDTDNSTHKMLFVP